MTRVSKARASSEAADPSWYPPSPSSSSDGARAHGNRGQHKRKHVEVNEPHQQAQVSAQPTKQDRSIMPPPKKSDGVKEQNPKAAHNDVSNHSAKDNGPSKKPDQVNGPPNNPTQFDGAPNDPAQVNTKRKSQDAADEPCAKKSKRLSAYRNRPFEIRVWSQEELVYSVFWPSAEITEELRKRSRPFQEALDGHVHFKSIAAAEEETCASYLHLVGHNEISMDDDEKSLSMEERWVRIIKLYVFAYNLADSTSARTVIDKVIEMLKAGSSLDSLLPAVKSAREKTDTKTGLYRLMVDYLAVEVDHARFEKMRGAFHDGDMMDVVVDVVVAAKKSRSGSAATWLAFGAAAYYPKL